MRVRTYGIEIIATAPTDAMGTYDFLKRLTKETGNQKTFKFCGLDRLLFMKERKGREFWGIFLTIRDHKRFVELLEDNQKNLKLAVNSFRANSNLVDFNYFILKETKTISPKSKFRGVYQSYKTSLSPDKFVDFLEEKYYEMNEEEAEQLKNSGYSETTIANQIGNRQIDAGLIYLPAGFKKLLEELKEINTIEYKCLKLDDSDNDQLKEVVKSDRRLIRFNRETSISKIIGGIMHLVGQNKTRSLKAIGKNSLGEDVPVRFSENAKTFTEGDFDQVAAVTDFDPKNFESGKYYEILQSCIQQNSYLFG